MLRPGVYRCKFDNSIALEVRETKASFILRFLGQYENQMSGMFQKSLRVVINKTRAKHLVQRYALYGDMLNDCFVLYPYSDTDNPYLFTHEDSIKEAEEYLRMVLLG